MPDIDFRLNSYGIVTDVLRDGQHLAYEGGKPVTLGPELAKLLQETLRSGQVRINGHDETVRLKGLISSGANLDIAAVIAQAVQAHPEIKIEKISEAEARQKQIQMSEALLAARTEAVKTATSLREAYLIPFTLPEVMKDVRIEDGNFALPKKATEGALDLAAKIMAYCKEQGTSVEQFFLQSGRDPEKAQAFAALDGDKTNFTREELAAVLLTYAGRHFGDRRKFISLIGSSVPMSDIGVLGEDVTKVAAVARQILGDNFLPSLGTNTPEADAAYLAQMTGKAKKGRSQE